MLKEYRKEFYRAWLLLGEVFSPSQFGADGLYYEARTSVSNAAASRHWYSTGTQAQEEHLAEDRLVPARLPGNYSVRGDWFLTIEGGSRSQHLGERAIDLLSSRRANMLRLQEGIGLPTRLFVEPATGDNIWTRLYYEYQSDSSGSVGKSSWVPIKYDDLKHHLGVPTATAGTTDFSWIWRSSLGSYRRQYRVFLKTAFRILYRWREKIEGKDKNWRSGFEAYDRIGNADWKDLPGGGWFNDEIDRWIKALKTSTPED